MRHPLLVLLAPLALAACASGYAKDWFRSPQSIVTPQLIRYGLDVEQSRCVGERMGTRLDRAEMRRFQERAAGVRQGLYDPSRFTVRDLRAIASATEGAEVRPALDAALAACNVGDLPATRIAEAPVDTGSGASPAAEGTRTSGGIPVDTTPIGAGAGAGGITGSGATAATWLNLGAADSGQSIAIDAGSIDQQGEVRTAWFRMTDPDSGAPSPNNYHLRVDCEGRTVQPLAIRTLAADGSQESLRQYTPEESTAGPAEAGTVLEIAYLSLCT